MEKKLSLLFDYQKFVNNKDLQHVIDAVHARHSGRMLSDEEVELVAAAGVPGMTSNQKTPWQDENDNA